MVVVAGALAKVSSHMHDADVPYDAFVLLQVTWFQSALSELVTSWMDGKSELADCITVPLMGTSQYAFANLSVCAGSKQVKVAILPVMAPKHEERIAILQDLCSRLELSKCNSPTFESINDCSDRLSAFLQLVGGNFRVLAYLLALLGGASVTGPAMEQGWTAGRRNLHHMLDFQQLQRVSLQNVLLPDFVIVHALVGQTALTYVYVKSSLLPAHAEPRVHLCMSSF